MIECLAHFGTVSQLTAITLDVFVSGCDIVQYMEHLAVKGTQLSV